MIIPINIYIYGYALLLLYTPPSFVLDSYLVEREPARRSELCHQTSLLQICVVMHGGVREGGKEAGRQSGRGCSTALQPISQEHAAAQVRDMYLSPAEQVRDSCSCP
jgi:hypothetical protein